MAKVRCTTCNTAFEISADSPTVKCPSCGKTYKNPTYKPPQEQTVQKEAAVTNAQTSAPTPVVAPMPSAMANLMQSAQSFANSSLHDDDTEKCVTHTTSQAVDSCDKCGAPICDICYNNFDMTDDEDGETYHFCADCYKDFIRAEREEAQDLKRMVKKEFIGIIAGMVIGLVLAIIFILDVMNGDASPILAVVGVYAMFLGGSFITIAKKIKNMYAENRSNDTGVNVFIIVLYVFIGILISPVVTITRIILRIIDYKKLNTIQAQVDELIVTLDRAIAESIAQAASMAMTTVANMADALESGGEEINIDFNLGDGVSIGANGEILRAIRTR